MEKETFGARLLKRRKELKLSQAALGKLVGVAHVTISQWERDETQPAGKRLIALADGLECTPTWLLFGDEDQTPTEPAPKPDLLEQLTPEQKELLELFEQLPDSDRAAEIESLRLRVENNRIRLSELLKARSRASKR
ncbi:transcriptional regulator [Salmonella enterica subsp. enterica serovar Legon]|uniref:Helix-turn-helix domain-containing protein n=1 Tax=Salmonella enterica subsp. enterica serovar Cardoner TaxID=2564309 RepID=A0A5V6PSK4_SALET|nr:helix-turn-helix domain-containing protein [Salmonella enterica]EBU8203414.1 helix-turn-helix domain-containing protein [Salmonella enterica subsp. enterica serovar Cardoner]EDV3146963.1 helix-turn-helix domain-containing protein [Salmonella enterica subsp. enterica]EDY6617162.1 helix-turn-helix domain-containing protein [Salmonella enterica subsp. enterica serovar Durham]EHJ0509576.1 helix-turn-helix domain-containing protein [Salmonella enterica subsp. enterica serovar Mishmarhaemek]EAV94